MTYINQHGYVLSDRAISFATALDLAKHKRQYRRNRNVYKRLSDYLGYLLMTHRIDVFFPFLTDYDEFRRHFPMNWKFVNIELSDTEVNSIDKWMAKNKVTPEILLQELLAKGYKISISWIDAQSAYVATMSGSDRSARNSGCSVTAWSDDIFEAVSFLAYKDMEIAGEQSWTVVEKVIPKRG